jgi:hypothetical protein
VTPQNEKNSPPQKKADGFKMRRQPTEWEKIFANHII